jgi:hypothetical protein
VGQRQDAWRRSTFVGRAAEHQAFEQLLESRESVLLYVWGPGGIGKSSLVHAFRERCERAKRSVALLDARFFPPTPEAFLRALGEAFGVEPEEALAQLAGKTPRVVLIDSYEASGALDDWLREHLLPKISMKTALVLASRQAPSAAWRAAPAWGSLVRPLPLRGLSPSESEALLDRRGVPSGRRAEAIAFAHGHPLALALVAEVITQGQGKPFSPETAPHVVRALLDTFLGGIADPDQRAALEASCLVDAITEPLLQAMTGSPEVHRSFRWLCERSFVTHSRFGVAPHDLVRELVSTDLRWRDFDRYASLFSRAFDFFRERLEVDAQRAWPALLHLLRQPGARVDASDSGLRCEPAAAGDVPELIELVRAHEGVESARLARGWLERGLQGVQVLRGPAGGIDGFLMTVTLTSAPPEALAADPATRAAMKYLEAHAPLRRGEVATMYRFWMAKDSYQRTSPAQTLIGTLVSQQNVMTPRLAISLFPVAEPEYYRPQLEFADTPHCFDYEVAGRRWSVFGRDWRKSGPAEWLTLLARRAAALGGGPTPVAESSIVLLREPQFRAAVRSALRRFAAAGGLEHNALLRAPLVVRRAAREGRGDAPAVLRELIREAIAELGRSSRTARRAAVLERTFLEAASKQTAIASELKLSFATYRRELGAGIEAVTEWLWQQELETE